MWSTAPVPPADRAAADRRMCCWPARPVPRRSSTSPRLTARATAGLVANTWRGNIATTGCSSAFAPFGQPALCLRPSVDRAWHRRLWRGSAYPVAATTLLTYLYDKREGDGHSLLALGTAAGAAAYRSARMARDLAAFKFRCARFRCEIIAAPAKRRSRRPSEHAPQRHRSPRRLPSCPWKLMFLLFCAMAGFGRRGAVFSAAGGQLHAVGAQAGPASSSCSW